MVTLSNFYKTAAWQRCRERVINERTRADGLTYCDLCGKPILKNIVGHHIEELTEGNVTDPEVSLNPDNIELLHIECHNKIHDRFQQNKKEVILVYGPPLTTLEYIEDTANINDFIISLDYIYKSLNPQNPFRKHTKAITSLAFEIRQALYDIAKYRTGKWSRCFIVGTFPNKNERERIKREVGIDEEVFIDITKEEAYKVAKRYNVHSNYYQYIDKFFEDLVR